jgi:DNA invertase Pin-like site-specific DNA recombinase
LRFRDTRSEHGRAPTATVSRCGPTTKASAAVADSTPGAASSTRSKRSGGRQVAGLVVYRLDRLARDLVLQEQLLADVRRMHADVFSTSTAEASYLGDDPDDPSRKLIRQVLGAVNEYERAMITLRLRSGRQRKAHKGGYAYGAPPFGFRAQGRELVEHPGEQATLARMHELRRSGASYRDIAAKLHAEGRQPKRGTIWHPMTVRQVLTRAPKTPC